MPDLFVAIAVALYVAITIVVVRKYLRTRDAGFIWLGVAVVIWPLISKLLTLGDGVFIDRVVRHQPVGFYPFNLIERGPMTLGTYVFVTASIERVIGVGLMLIAVLYLCKTKRKANAEAQA